MTRKTTRAAKTSPPRTRKTRTTRALASSTLQRRFLAADIAAATLMGYREGAAAATASSILSTHAESISVEKESDAPIKILADGTICDPGDPRTDHVAVLLPAAGLMVHPVSLGTPEGDPLPSHDACVAACRALRVLGFDDWMLARREDWHHFLKFDRFDPAVDTTQYPGIKPKWHWTGTDCAWSEKDAAGRSLSAWYVDASGGLVVSSLPRNGSGFALAVRRVGQ